MTHKVLCTDNLAKEGVELLESSQDVEVSFIPSLTHEELIEKIPAYDALIVRSASKVKRDVIEAGANLKIIARAGVGVDNIDISAATEKGIFVVNTPEGNTTSTAEHTFAMILSLARHIPQAASAMAGGRWEKKKYMGKEISGKTLGIIGLGHIGREVAKRARAFGMNVIGYDPNLSSELFASLGVEPSSLEEIYRNSDFITIHATLNEKTKDLIGKNEFVMMKATACIINCARGGIVNEEDLAYALKNKVIAGAALDVFTKEPFDKQIFEGLENIILTPHLGASTTEAQVSVALEAARAVSQFFKEGISFNAVNLIADVSLPEYKKEIVLVEKLGLLLSQLSSKPIKGIKFASKSSAPNVLVLAAIKGVLSKSAKERVTLVNASMIAKESGLPVTKESVEEDHDFSNAIGLIAEVKNERHEVWGAVLADGTSRIVSLDGFNVEVDPEGPILLIHNSDKPGVIAGVSTVLGEMEVNIAEMQNVRKKKGAEALTIIRIDEEVSEDALKKIKSVNGVTNAVLVSL